MEAERRLSGHFADPQEEGLSPLVPLDLSRIDSFDALLRGFSSASFGARRLGEGAEVLSAMVSDPHCFTVLTLSGAMTVAKMGLVMVEMIERGYVQAVVSTGALMTHGLVENSGHHHYKYRSGLDDRKLYEKGYNRVYDTIEPEENLNQAQRILDEVLSRGDLPSTLSSRALTHAIGRFLKERHGSQRGPLSAAYAKDVPVYIPAFTDSELGLEFAVHNHGRRGRGLLPLAYDPFLDLDHFRETACRAKRLGIFTIGGGVPRNWAQQVGPYVEVLAHRLGMPAQVVRFSYGVRICPDSEHLGGLSGCTYREGVSWGKFVAEEDGGRFAEVLADATIAWPLIVKAVMERVPLKAVV